MNRFSNRDDDNFETVTGTDGKPTRILKDKGRVRISMQMRDSLSPLQRSVADSTARDNNPITDGTDNPFALNKPGWRIPTMQDRRAVVGDAAYRRYELGQIRAHRLGDSVQCAECFGSGEDEDGEACSACNGTGIMPERGTGRSKGFGSRNEAGYDNGDDPDPASDSRTLDQRMRDHAANMADIYRERDLELSQMWRTK